MAFGADQAAIRFTQDKLEGVYYTLDSWEGYDEFHRVSEHIIVIRTRDNTLKLEDFFLQPAELEIDCHKDKDKLEPRKIKGIIRKVSVDADEANQFLYTFYVVPQLWRLSQKDHTRIFQEMSSKEIIQSVIGEYGISVEMKLKKDPRKREYCVQYQETDLNFISRLAEDDGFYFYFKQDEDKVFFIDDPSNVTAAEPLKDFAWDPGEGFEQLMPETVRSLTNKQQPRWKDVMVKDYNYNTPDTELLKQNQADKGEGSSYLYLTGHTTGSEGETLAQLRLQEQRAEQEVLTLTSTIRSTVVGKKYTLKDFPVEAFNIEYQILRINHTYKQNTYRNVFTCIPVSIPYRPPRITRRPIIAGLQTAIVVGPSGYEDHGNSSQDIYVDEMGRIKVLFHWDIDKNRNEKSSCWVRLMREYAGPNYGVFFLPRVGNEVLISFLEGNPDRPIVVGSVHHANNVPPIQLPGNKTQNTSLMPSTNEFRFEDKEGSEQIYMHAQKDHIRLVENDETITVGHDRSRTVKHDETISIENDRKKTITNNETTKVGVNRTETVGSNENITIGANRTETVKANETISILGKRECTISKTEGRTVMLSRSTKIGLKESLMVGGMRSVTVGASNSLTVAAMCSVKVGASFKRTTIGSEKLDVKGQRKETIGTGRTVIVKSGNNSVKVQGGDNFLKVKGNNSVTVQNGYTTKVTNDYKLQAKKVTIQANDQITIKTGQASIVMKKSGDIDIKGAKLTVDGRQVQIKGMQDVKINAMNITSEATVNNKMKGAMTNVEASGINTIKGSLVKIN